MKRLIRTLASTGVALSLAVSGVGMASAATPLQSAPVVNVVPDNPVTSAPVAPRVAYIWWIWQDNYYTKETCTAASFNVLSTHAYIRDYQCLKNEIGKINAGRWSLWVYAPDSIYPIH